MIYYLTTARSAGAMGNYLMTWGKSLAQRIRILSYERIFSGEPIALARGVYIFSSVRQALGSYNPPSRERQMVAKLRNDIIERWGPHSALNDPMLSMRRLTMLQALHARGMNRFNAYLVNDVPRTARFPLFLRNDYGTQYEHTPLLHDRAELQAALASGSSRSDLLAIEFCDTADKDRVYRKFGTFVVGERIVPRHLFFSHHWMVKLADLTEQDRLAEELAYMESDAHADALREVCRFAHIDYGRVDYAFWQGRMQVWEINVTPAIVQPSAANDAVRPRVHERFTELFTVALDALESAAS
jgi:hypothetical protein